MGKRLFCLLLVMVLTVVSLWGIRTEAAVPDRTKPSNSVSAARVARSTSALVSAMFLVLAGISITLLFDKK